MKLAIQNQLEIVFTPFGPWPEKPDVGTCRLSPVTPTSEVDELIDRHGLDSVAQAFLRVLRPGDEVEVCRKKWTVTARSKDGNSLTVIVGNEKPLVIKERYVSYVVSREGGREIRCAPHWVWDSRKTGSKMKVPIVESLLRDVESELLAYKLTVQQFKRNSPFVDIVKRCLSKDCLTAPCSPNTSDGRQR